MSLTDVALNQTAIASNAFFATIWSIQGHTERALKRVGGQVRAESAAIGWRMTLSRMEPHQAQSRFQHRSA